MLSCDWLLQIYMCKQFRKRQIVTDVAGLIIFKNRKVLYTVSTEVRHHRSQVDIIQFIKTYKQDTQTPILISHAKSNVKVVLCICASTGDLTSPLVNFSHKSQMVLY